jgi:hypothetical protein
VVYGYKANDSDAVLNNDDDEATYPKLPRDSEFHQAEYSVAQG